MMMKRRAKIALERLDRDGEMVFRVAGLRWSKACSTELRVSREGLEATGDLGAYKRGTLRLPWERVSELHYAPADRGAVEGLYAYEGEWCARCVLRGVSEAQADSVIAAIARHYPRLAKSPESAVESAVGEVLLHTSAVQRRWLPIFGRRGVSVASPMSRV